ncbi:polysaccharide export protein [Roseibacterium sp. SDUM158016]|uniref:polysaccharide biosynthesis/export family protein n=1 Tax=Roseicyclus sediminis TaxID=2980997 RepID=UPI0021D32CF0|nr:polysaccharide biosynthesis/export family protein [Roseibacterium sp. SDUM158016]MCU4653747.1 polysaccharide export protein [Roseibacterium sp. SDUM158016]
MIRTVAFGLMALSLSACAGGGPSARAIVGGSESTVASRAETLPYIVVDVDESIATIVSRSLDVAPQFFGDQAPTPVIIGVGDTVQISIVSSSETGFLDFTTASISPISSTSLPPQTVRESGNINVPPIGRLRAAGQTIQSFETLLERRLGEVLIEPSVIVELVDRQSARVNVAGQVAAPGAVPLTEVNTRLIDVILAAGGPSGRTEDYMVRLSRSGSTHAVSLQRLYEDPRFNIIVRPGDVVAVEPADRKFTVLGATGNQTFRFDEQEVSLAEALSQAGGLQSPRANRTGVFLYRRVPRDVLASLGADIAHIPGNEITTIFRFDFTEPSVLFTANSFDVADGDVLYIADSVNAEVTNVLSVLTNFLPAPVEFSRDAIFGQD